MIVQTCTNYVRTAPFFHLSIIKFFWSVQMVQLFHSNDEQDCGDRMTEDLIRVSTKIGFKLKDKKNLFWSVSNCFPFKLMAERGVATFYDLPWGQFHQICSYRAF